MVLELLSGVSYSTLALAVGSIVFAIAWWNTSNPRNLPPAPTGFPILGILPIFVSKLRAGKHVEYLISLHKKLGPILTFKAGALRFVWINDGALVKDMLRREEFSLRPSHLPVIRLISEGKEKGIGLSNGETNTEMRRFALLALRDFGVGKKGLDEIVQTEASVLTGQLEIYANENDGVISDILAKMQAATANVIHNVIFGYRNEYDDPKFKEIFSKLMALTTFNPLAFPENFFPFLRHIPFLGSFLNAQPQKVLALDREAGKYMNEQIEEHRKSYCSDEIRDFIDLFIKYETEHREFYTTENIFASILDLFRAGIVTTAISLSWCTMYLARFPAIQKQVVAEIDEVIGDQVFDTKKHKAKLIKTRAFVNEMLRYVTIAGFSAPHTTLVDAEAGGYTIPAGSLVFVNIFALHHDKGYWGDPEVFRIERWIDENGELLNHSDYFMPFSTGKRACPGKQLAKIEILLILIEMLQKFTFEQPLGTSDMTDEPGKGLIRAPKDFHMKIVKRT